MSIDVGDIVERARLAAARPAGAEGGGDARRTLERMAQEFESMLLVQMLRGMRTAGSWEAEGGGDTLGAESMYETLDVELASHLARVQGLGLSEQLLQAFDRMNAEGRKDTGLGARASGLGNIESPARVTEYAAAAPSVPTADPRIPSPEPRIPSPEPRTPSPEPRAPSPELRAPSPEPRAPITGSVTSDFGWRSDPFTGQARFHRGVDLRAAYGQDVYAAAGGRVVFSGEQGGYGTTVLIEHADGTRTRYAHLSAALVASGDDVAAGHPVGQAGRSGRATGTHLHFEVIGADGRPMDPRIAGLVGNGA